MANIILDPTLLDNIKGKTVLITGALGGIGQALVRLYASHGANVVLSDLNLPHSLSAAETIISSLPDPSRAIFVPANTVVWKDMLELFRRGKENFGRIDAVIANAGVMESSEVLDVESVDENGDLLESAEANRVIDINVKGTLNTLRLGLHHMKDNQERNGSGGSIVLVISTSGYVGGTGVVAYVASKHAITGLLRSSQLMATRFNVRINAVAPFVTPTEMTGSYSKEWIERGLPRNTTEQVASVVASISMDGERRGACYLTCGHIIREMEFTQKAMMGQWLGEDVVELMQSASDFFKSIGGVPASEAQGYGFLKQSFSKFEGNRLTAGKTEQEKDVLL